MNTKYSKRDGHTFIELLTVIAIISILAFFVLPNIRQGERRQLLRQAALRLVQDLRDMEERAISSRELPGSNTCPVGLNPASSIPKAYGIEFNRAVLGDTAYFFFADCGAADGIYNPGPPNESALLDPNYSPLNEIPTVRQMPIGVVLDQKQHVDVSGFDYSPVNPNRLAVSFSPPDPITRIKVDASAMVHEQARFRLKITGADCAITPADCMTVWVGETGRVFIQ